MQCFAGVDQGSLPGRNLGVGVPFHSGHFERFVPVRIFLIGKGAVDLPQSSTGGATVQVLAPLAALGAF